LCVVGHKIDWSSYKILKNKKLIILYKMDATDDEDCYKKNSKYMRLMNTVTEYSECCEIHVARKEWHIISKYYEEDGVSCLCGQQDCKYVYVIKNNNNHNELSPIGSECMKYFELNEQETTIFEAYEKWHFKKYNVPYSVYYQVAFHEIIKDVAYIHSIDKYDNISKEQERLVKYAKAVWVHNPPPLPLSPSPPPPPPPPSPPPPSVVCQKCVEQLRKGYKKCYECFIKQSPKPKCRKCEEQQKKGFLRCYACYKEKQ